MSNGDAGPAVGVEGESRPDYLVCRDGMLHALATVADALDWGDANLALSCFNLYDRWRQELDAYLLDLANRVQEAAAASLVEGP